MLGFRVQGLLGLRRSRAQSFRDLDCEFRSEVSEGRVAAVSVQEWIERNVGSRFRVQRLCSGVEDVWLGM